MNLTAKYMSDRSAKCLECKESLKATGLVRNKKHVYDVGIMYECPCGKSKLWTNSARNEKALVGFLEGKAHPVYGEPAYTQGFCNDRFDGFSFEPVKVLSGGYDFPGVEEPADVIGNYSVKVAYWKDEEYPAEGSEGKNKLIDWYRRHLPELKALAGRGLAASSQKTLPSSVVQEDLLDAIEHADVYGDGWDLTDFNISYMGELPLEKVREYEDWSGWVEVRPEHYEGLTIGERLKELAAFRGATWSENAATWLKNGVPPIVIVETPEGHTQLGDGRGRVNFAIAMGLKKLPAVLMQWKQRPEPEVEAAARQPSELGKRWRRRGMGIEKLAKEADITCPSCGSEMHKAYQMKDGKREKRAVCPECDYQEVRGSAPSDGAVIEAAPYDGWKDLKPGKLPAPVELQDSEALWNSIAERIGHDVAKGIQMRAPIIGGRRRYHHRKLRSYHLSNDRTLTLTTDELEAKTWNNLKSKRHPAMPRIYDVFSVRKKGQGKPAVWAIVHEQLMWPVPEDWDLFVDSFFKWRAMEREALSPAKATDLEGFLRWVIDPEEADPKTTQKNRIEVVLPWKMTRQRRDDVADRRKKLFGMADLEGKIKWAKSALQYLKQNKVKFRDFDPSNLAVTKKGNRVVITNLAESRSAPSKTGRTGQVKGSSDGTWYHTTSWERLPSILRDGLKVNQPATYSQASSSYMKDVYGVVPVFVSKRQTPYDKNHDGVVLAVDVSGLKLAADIPSLADNGAYIEEDHIWFEDPPAGMPDEEVYFEDLLPGGSETDAAIALTGTAAVLQNIDPSRITVLEPVASGSALVAREGDKVVNERALALYRELQAALAKIQPSDVEKRRNGGLKVNLKNLTSDPDLSTLSFIVHAGSDTSFEERRKTIIIGQPAKDVWSKLGPEATPAEELEVFRAVLSDPKKKTSIVHELIHFIDSKRFSFSKADRDYKSPDEDYVAYANHPIETNAYFQAALSHVLDEHNAMLADIEDGTGPDNQGSNDHQVAVWKLKDFVTHGFSDFFSKWRNQFKVQWPVVSDANKKKFRARVYQVYDRLARDANKKLKELKDRQDPMAMEL